MNRHGFKILGEDFFLGKYCDITRPELCEVGNHSAIDSFFYCTPKLIIGDYVHISSHVGVIGGKDSFLKLGDFSFIATGSKIICGSEDYTADGLMGATVPKQYKSPTKIAPVTFENFTGIGANTTVMPGVILREGSVVGANSLVTKSTEPWTIYVGSPAKPIKIRECKNIKKYYKEMGYE